MVFMLLMLLMLLMYNLYNLYYLFVALLREVGLDFARSRERKITPPPLSPQAQPYIKFVCQTLSIQIKQVSGNVWRDISAGMGPSS